MDRITLKLPNKITVFIGKNYPNHSLICTKESDDRKGNVSYLVDLVKDETYYHLKITEFGKLIAEESEPVCGTGYREQYY